MTLFRKAAIFRFSGGFFGRWKRVRPMIEAPRNRLRESRGRCSTSDHRSLDRLSKKKLRSRAARRNAVGISGLKPRSDERLRAGILLASYARGVGLFDKRLVGGFNLDNELAPRLRRDFWRRVGDHVEARFLAPAC